MIHRLELGSPDSAIFDRNVLESWKKQWVVELGKWHSPYKALVDLRVLDAQHFESHLDFGLEFAGLLRFFFGFFMQHGAVVAQPEVAKMLLEQEKVEVFQSFDEALAKVGLDKQVGGRKSADFRSVIQLQNHFAQRTMELSFEEPTLVDTVEKMKTIQSKITNNLMQWHSKWNLLIDTQNLQAYADKAGVERWATLFEYLKKLFMLQAIGYGSKDLGETLPCKVYRARHKAVAALDSATEMASDEAHCRSKK